MKMGSAKLMEAREHRLECGNDLEGVSNKDGVYLMRCKGCGKMWAWNYFEWPDAKEMAMALHGAWNSGLLIVFLEVE